MPTRLPLAPLVVLAVSCALMGVSVGVWMQWQREPLAARTEARPPTPPPPGPTFNPAPSPRYPAPAGPAAPPSLPPARVTPPGWGATAGAGRVPGAAWGVTPGVRRAALPPPSGAPAPPTAPNPAPARPLKAKGMATIRISNPSAQAIEVTLSGTDTQVGVVGPRANVEFLIPPGRYDVALRGATRTQRFYDAPLTEGELLALVYSERR